MDIELPERERNAFQATLELLNAAKVPFTVAGAFAVHYYTGIWRYTKDMDIFLLPEDVWSAMEVLANAGFDTHMEAEHWLAKAFCDGVMVDLIFGSGNWLAPVDQIWLDRSEKAMILDQPVFVAPVEEMIWSKAYVAVRHRYDGADINHMIHAVRGNLDWNHLLSRFGEHWQLLYSYVNLFRFVYPSDKDFVPRWVMDRFLALQREDLHMSTARDRVCRGPLLDRFSYTFDIEVEGYIDPREELAVERGGDAAKVILDREGALEESMQGWVW